MHEIIKIVKDIDCSKIKPSECSDNIVTKLKSLVKLRADKETDTVHGHLDIDHGYTGDTIQRKHTIKIYIYTKDESPNEEHKTTLKKPSKIPTESEIKKII